MIIYVYICNFVIVKKFGNVCFVIVGTFDTKCSSDNQKLHYYQYFRITWDLIHSGPVSPLDILDVMNQ